MWVGLWGWEPVPDGLFGGVDTVDGCASPCGSGISPMQSTVSSTKPVSFASWGSRPSSIARRGALLPLQIPAVKPILLSTYKSPSLEGLLGYPWPGRNSCGDVYAHICGGGLLLMSTACAKSRITFLGSVTTSPQSFWHFHLGFVGCLLHGAGRCVSCCIPKISLTFLWGFSRAPKELNGQLHWVMESMFINNVLFKIQSKCNDGKRCRMTGTENYFFHLEPEQMQGLLPQLPGPSVSLCG